jgi:hypothetical protein
MILIEWQPLPVLSLLLKPSPAPQIRSTSVKDAQAPEGGAGCWQDAGVLILLTLAPHIRTQVYPEHSNGRGMTYELPNVNA